MNLHPDLCTDGWERNLPRTARQLAEALAAQREAERDWAFAAVQFGDALCSWTPVRRAAYSARVNWLRASGAKGGHDYQLARTWAVAMAASIADGQERCHVQMVIDAMDNCRPLPSWASMTPLMRAAAHALQGKTRPWEPVLTPAHLAAYLEAKHAYEAMVEKYGRDHVPGTPWPRPVARTEAEVDRLKAEGGYEGTAGPLCCQRYGRLHEPAFSVGSCQWLGVVL